MVLRMDNNVRAQDYGPRLAEYIDGLRDGRSMREFAMTLGLDPAQISKWKAGSTPSLEQLRLVANALGETLGTVLVVAGFGTTKDFTVSSTVPKPPPAADVGHAIRHDVKLSDTERATLAHVWDALLAGRRGRGRGSKTFRV